MNLASDGGRDAVAEFLAGTFGLIGDAFGWLFGNLDAAAWIVGGLVVLYLLWRLSVTFGPKRLCWWCGGSGHRGGLFGGRRKCTHCDGGLQDRMGSGGHK